MGGVLTSPQTPGNGRIRAATKAASAVVLSAEESAVLRDRLLNEVTALQSHDNATVWAREALPLKNKLIEADANLVGETFERKLSEFMGPEAVAPMSNDFSPTSIASSSNPSAHQNPPTDVADQRQARIDKSVLTVSAPRRYRNKAHLRFVTQQPCLLCGRKPSDAHHLSFVQPRALGRKASDEFAVPLCRIHHRAVHRARDERGWWKATAIDPIKVARKLWKDTQRAPNPAKLATALPISPPAVLVDKGDA
jgi:hypothetical protein